MNGSDVHDAANSQVQATGLRATIATEVLGFSILQEVYLWPVVQRVSLDSVTASCVTFAERIVAKGPRLRNTLKGHIRLSPTKLIKSASRMAPGMSLQTLVMIQFQPRTETLFLPMFLQGALYRTLGLVVQPAQYANKNPNAHRYDA